MKKLLFFLFIILLAAATWLFLQFRTSSSPTVIYLGDTPLTLSRVYSNAEGPVNMYSSGQEGDVTAVIISQYPLPAHLSFEHTLKDMQNTVRRLSKDTWRITPQPNAKNPYITLAMLQNDIYIFIRRIWTANNTVKEITAMVPALGQSFARADQQLSAGLEKITDPIVYTVRPGQSRPDNSEALEQLKNALQAAYRPETQVNKRGNITSVNTVDRNENAALYVILHSKEPDVTSWLQEHIGEYSPKYLFAMAYRMASLKAPIRDVVFWGELARLRGAADAALCKDRHVGQYILILHLDLIQPALDLYKNDPQAQAFLANTELSKQVMKEAVNWDIAHPQTNSPDWICKSGHAVSTSASYPQNEWEQRRQDFKRKYTASLYK